MKPTERRYTISQLAKEAGVTLKTIRHYLECDLIKHTEVTSSGYRIFNNVTLEVIRKIKRLQKAGYTLEQIRNILYNQLDTNDISERRRQLEAEVSEKELVLNQLILAEANSQLRSEPLSLSAELEISDIVLNMSSPEFLKRVASIVAGLPAKERNKVKDLNCIFLKILLHFIKKRTLPTDKKVGAVVNEMLSATSDIFGHEIAIQLYEINLKFLCDDHHATLLTDGDQKLVNFMAAALDYWKPENNN
jgi:DNA-binding transcriptional MerR regulator